MKNKVLFIIGAIILIIVAFLIGYYIKPDNASDITNLQTQLNQSQKTNVNLNAYVVSLESQIEDFKKVSKTINTGVVPFWGEDDSQLLNIRVPLDSMTVRKYSLEIIKLSAGNISSKDYKISSPKKDGKKWDVNFTCDENNTELSLCSGDIMIDETDRAFSLIPA